jgi:Carboxypeptidase regulatory-like domain/TonB dependent receptor-like, beta-barrel/TonB-dependent Receptor Plug Domain
MGDRSVTVVGGLKSLTLCSQGSGRFESILLTLWSPCRGWRLTTRLVIDSRQSASSGMIRSKSGRKFREKEEVDMFLPSRKQRRISGLRLLEILALGLVLGITSVCPVYGQVAGATLSGQVTDASGAVIPHAQVSIKNTATGVTRDVTTDTAGFYSVPNLLPGSYDVSTSAPGFSTQVQTGIILTVGAQQVLNASLQVGQVTQKVLVTGAAPTVQLASSALSATVNSTTVRELPLNGRSWTDLATLQPGVSAIQTQAQFNTGSSRGNRGFGNQVTISGARPQQNNYRLDGISINDYSNGAPGSVLGGNLGVDSIQEFSVLTSNYSTEYGRTSGGVINAITRSGTNQFHGDAYEFLRNSALDARNFFDKTTPPFKRNQFGASAGGPIRKDRTFIFGDYEGIHQSLGLTNLITVPSAAARGGQLCSKPTGSPPTCSPTRIVVDPMVQKYFPLFPLPNGPLKANGDTGIYSFAIQQKVSENFFTTRLDHRFSQKDSIFGTYLFDNTPFTTPDNYDNVLTGDQTKRQTFILEEDHTFSPTLVNSLRFGFNRNFVNNATTIGAINPVAADKSLGAVPGLAATQVSVPGMSTFNGGVGGQSFYYRWNSFQTYDDAFFTRGLHSLKLGVAFEREQLNELSNSSPLGTFTFGSLSAFLTNHPKRFKAAFPNLLTPRGLRQTIFGSYIQDDWRWRPNLTLNLGLRYEMTTVPTEVQGKIANLYNLTDANPHLGNPFFSNPTLRNFEPRIGFAWDPFRNGETAVRGGFGFFDVLPLPYEIMTMVVRAAPFFVIGNTGNLTPGSFFAGAFGSLGSTTFEEASVEHNPHRNYVLQWNLNIQRELTPNLTALIGYVGARGIHQPFRSDDADIVIPNLTSQGYVWPSPVGSGTTLNQHYGDIRYVNWGGNSFFNALELGVTRRMSHGLQIQGSYTWGKSIDTNSGVVNGDTFSNSITGLPWYDLKLARGLSDFNIGRTLVISGTWQVPTLNSVSGPMARLVNGWELGGIFKGSDGVPFTPTFAATTGDPLGLNSSAPWDYPNRLTGPGCGTLINPRDPNNYIKTQCFAVPTAASTAFYTSYCDPQKGTSPQCFNLLGNAGRNILTGPGTVNLDFSLYKDNYIKRVSENFNVQFRVEIFNILNRANFALPITPDNSDIFDANGAPTGVAGLLTSTTTTAREIQFALKLIW